MGVDMPHYFGSDFLLRVRGFQMTRRSKPQAANMPGPTVHSAVRLAIVSPHDCPKAPPTGISTWCHRASDHPQTPQRQPFNPTLMGTWKYHVVMNTLNPRRV